MRFIDQHAARASAGRRWGVASICAQLTELGAAIAPSTYYAARAAAPTAAQRRDQALAVQIARVHAENYGVYGARKVWAQLNREGIEVARCTVERLMRAHGLAGARRGRRIRTTIAGDGPRAADLVGRRFSPPAPDRLWVTTSPTSRPGRGCHSRPGPRRPSAPPAPATPADRGARNDLP